MNEKISREIELFVAGINGLEETIVAKSGSNRKLKLNTIRSWLNVVSADYADTTYAALAAALLADAVTPGQKFRITDSTSGDDFGMYVDTIRNPFTGKVGVKNDAIAFNLWADIAGTGDYGDVLAYTSVAAGTPLGVWSIATEGGAVLGDFVVFNGQNYQVISFGDINGTDPATNTLAYQLLDRADVISMGLKLGYSINKVKAEYSFISDTVSFWSLPNGTKINALSFLTYQWGGAMTATMSDINGVLSNINSQISAGRAIIEGAHNEWHADNCVAASVFVEMRGSHNIADSTNEITNSVGIFCAGVLNNIYRTNNTGNTLATSCDGALLIIDLTSNSGNNGLYKLSGYSNSADYSSNTGNNVGLIMDGSNNINTGTANAMNANLKIAGESNALLNSGAAGDSAMINMFGISQNIDITAMIPGDSAAGIASTVAGAPYIFIAGSGANTFYL